MPSKIKLRHTSKKRATDANPAASSTTTASTNQSTNQSTNKLRDDQLFFVDAVPAKLPRHAAAATVEPLRSKRKRADSTVDNDDDDDDGDGHGGGPQAPRRVDVARARVLGIDAALALNSAIKPLVKPKTKSRVVKPVPKVVQSIKKFRAHGEQLGVDPVTAHKIGFERSVDILKQRHIPAAGTYDIWNDAAVPARVARNVSRKKRAPAVTRSESLRAAAIKTIPAVMPPLNAESVNPKMDDVLDLAASTALRYERDERDEADAAQVVRAVKNRKVAAILEAMDEMDAHEAAEEAADNATGPAAAAAVAAAVAAAAAPEGEDDDTSSVSEETRAALLAAAKPSTPRPLLRESDIKRKAINQRNANWAHQQARENSQFAQLDTIVAELAAEATVAAERKRKRRAKGEKMAAASAGVGRNRFKEADAHIVLPRRVVHNAGRLVRVAASPYAARDLMKSLQRRGKLESQSKHNIQDSRVEYNVK